MDFKNFLALFLLIPVLIIVSVGVVLFFFSEKKSRKIFGKKLDSMRNYQDKKSKKIVLLLSALSLFFAVLVLSEPIGGEAMTTVKVKGADLVFILDSSKSMLARDMDSNKRISRLDIAKNTIKKIVQSREGDRFGLVLFAGESFVFSPLTFDKKTFLDFLDSADTDSINLGGTNFEKAISDALSVFDPEEKRGRALVLISDGEGQEGDPDAVLSEAKKLGVSVYTIGIGSREGGEIIDGFDLFGSPIYKQHQGKVVKTYLNEKILKSIAEKADGSYFRIKSSFDVSDIFAELSKIKITTAKVPKNQRMALFPYLAFLIAVAFSIYVFLPTFSRKNIFVLILLLNFSSCTLEANIYSEKGRKRYSDGFYKTALDDFETALEKDEGNPDIFKNKGDTLFRLGLFDDAERAFTEALGNLGSEEEIKKSEVLYNLGNTHYRQGEKKNNPEEKLSLLEKSVEKFTESLKANPNNQFAKENLEFVKKKIEELKKQNPELDQEKNQENQENQDEKKQGDQKENEKNKENEEQGKQGEKNKDSKSKENESESQERKLSQGTKKQIEEYKKNLEKEQKRLQKLFNRNPEKKKSLQEMMMEQEQGEGRKDW